MSIWRESAGRVGRPVPYDRTYVQHSSAHARRGILAPLHNLSWHRNKRSRLTPRKPLVSYIVFRTYIAIRSVYWHPSKVLYQQRLSIHTTHFTGSVDLLHSSTSGANTMHLIQLYDKSPYEIRYLTNLFRPASHSHVRNRLVYRNIKHAAKSILNPRDILITVVLISSTALKVCS
jgi:hypothetical protein